jgi:hypothetical protein
MPVVEGVGAGLSPDSWRVGSSGSSSSSSSSGGSDKKEKKKVVCKLSVGLFMPDMRSDKFGAVNAGAAYSMRLANADVGWSVVEKTAKSAQGGVNVLGEVTVTL